MSIEQKNNDTNQTILNEEIITNEQILGELAILLKQDNPTDADCISLHDVRQLILKNHNDFNKIINSAKKYITRVLKRKYSDPKVSIRCIKRDEVDKILLTINSHHIWLIKQDGELLIDNPSIYSNEIMVLLGNGLSELFDIVTQYSDFLNEVEYNIESSNSSFLIDSIDNNGVVISNSERFKLYCDDDFYYYSTSNNLINAFQGREDILLKRIFVDIDKCPEWARETLYQIRQKQLVKENKKAKVRM